MNEPKSGRSTRNVWSTWRRGAWGRAGGPPVALAEQARQKEEVLEAAVNDYYRLRREGAPVTATQFCERYPSYRKSLRRLIDVQEEIDDLDLDDLGDEWPQPICEFLGFELLHQLGAGAIARVYLANELELGRLVALKVSLHGGDEAKTLAKLCHPNIVPVYSVQQDEASGMTAICMPYHGSATLADLLDLAFEQGVPPQRANVVLEAACQREQIASFLEAARDRSQPAKILREGTYVDAVVHLSIQMARALEYTHANGILHRDLKPSNVLLTPDGVPMLLDFNLATDIDQQGPRLGGTLPYMPPEQIRAVHFRPLDADAARDPRADIFALGVIVYELLTGCLPFGDPPAEMSPKEAARQYLEAQQRPVKPVTRLNPQVSRSLAHVIEQCLAIEIEQRPGSATEVARLLQSHFSARSRFVRWLGRHQTVALTTALCLIAAGLLAGWHFATRLPYEVQLQEAALTALQEGEPGRAIEYFDRALAANPGSPEVLYFARGVTHQQMEGHERAAADLEQALQGGDDKLVGECLAYSLACLSSQAFRAQIIYQQLLVSDPNNVRLRQNLAYTYFLENIPSRAEEHLEAVLKAEPQSVSAHYLRALVRYKLAEEAPQPLTDEAAERARLIAQSAIDDIETVLRLVPADQVDARLLFNAAEVHALANPQVATRRLKELVLRAAQAGTPRYQVEFLGKNKGWEGEPWFVEATEICPISTEAAARLHARFMAPPPQQEIQRRLLLACQQPSR